VTTSGDQGTARPARTLFRNRDFMLLWSGQIVSALGSRVSMIAYPLLALALTHSPADAGLVGFAGTLPYLLLQLPGGGLVDRWNRKRTMIECDAIRAAALLVLAFAAWRGLAGIPLVMAVAFVDGAMFIVFGLAEGAALPHVVPAEQLSSAIAQNEAKSRGAQLAGQPIGGLLFELGHAFPFLADAASYVVSVATLALIRTEFQVEAPERRPLHAEIAEGFAWLWRQPFLRDCALLVGASNFMFQAMVLVVIVLARSRGASAAMIGLIFGCVGVGGLLGSFVAPWVSRNLGTRFVVVGVNWVWAALLPLFVLVPWPIAYGPIFGLSAFVGPPWNVVVSTYELALTPDRMLGRVQGVEGLLAWGSIPLGSLVAGLVLERVGPVPTTWAMTVFTLGIAVVAGLSPGVRDVPALPSETRAAA
jgi:MFS family permease